MRKKQIARKQQIYLQKGNYFRYFLHLDRTDGCRLQKKGDRVPKVLKKINKIKKHAKYFALQKKGEFCENWGVFK